MKIVQLANFYSPTSGGLRTTLRALASEYQSAGHDVVRIVPGDERSSLHDGTATVITLPSARLGGTGYRIVRSTAATEQLLRQLAPDVIELSDKTTLVGPAARERRHGARVVLLSHERLDAILRPRVPRGFPLSSSADVWNRRLARKVDAVVCASRFAAGEWRRIGASHVNVVPFGVDLDTFTPSTVGGTGADDRLRIALVGRLSKEKRPELAIDTVRLLQALGVPCVLRVAGTGPMLDELRARASGLPVEFLGHLDGAAAVARLLRESDIALAPCGVETFGLAALEAMACGTPVVAADSGALPELVVTGTGLAVAPTDRLFAAAAIELRALGGSDTRLRARAHAEHFSWAATAHRLLEMYSSESVLESQGSGGSR